MKIAVVGLGAIGGLIAARLADAGHNVSGLARGATLEAVRRRGICIEEAGTQKCSLVKSSSDARELGEQDLVVIALKAQALPAIAATLGPLLGPQTVVMPAMNGVPWWFLQAGEAPLTDRRLASVDPEGLTGAALGLESVLGCVVHLSCSTPEPGWVRRGFGDRLIVGEPRGGSSARVSAVCELLSSGGFQAEASTNIRHDIWYKLWGNMTMNPVSALTGATTDHILDDPLVRAFVLRSMGEAARIGARIGCHISQSGEERMALTRELGSFKTSMLQDALASRTLEIDALVSAVYEIGTRLELDLPNIGALLGLTRLMARERGLYPCAP